MEHALGEHTTLFEALYSHDVLILIVMEHALGGHLRRRRGPSLPKS